MNKPLLDLVSFRSALEGELELAYARAFKEAEKVDPSYADLICEVALLSSRGGKRLRPYIAYLAYRGSGGLDEEEIIRAVAGLEIFHTFLLVHDDIIDRDQTRYGGPTVAARYRGHLGIEGDASHFAMSAALLAGDSGSALARRQIADSGFSADSRLRALQELDNVLFLTCGGQFVDSLGPSMQGSNLEKEQILSIYKHKTALYSFDLPLRIGMLLAGASMDDISSTKSISIPLGIAYQMRDDYLGIFGDEASTGKSAMSDIREGKQTYLHALVGERASAEQLELLQKYYGNPLVTGVQAHIVRTIFQESGACQAVETLIEGYVSEASFALQEGGLDDEAKDVLDGLIASGLRRDN